MFGVYCCEEGGGGLESWGCWGWGWGGGWFWIGLGAVAAGGWGWVGGGGGDGWFVEDYAAWVEFDVARWFLNITDVRLWINLDEEMVVRWDLPCWLLDSLQVWGGRCGLDGRQLGSRERLAMNEEWFWAGRGVARTGSTYYIIAKYFTYHQVVSGLERRGRCCIKLRTFVRVELLIEFLESLVSGFCFILEEDVAVLLVVLWRSGNL